MPVILKLEAPVSPGAACIHKVKGTKCVTETGTYNFTEVFEPTTPISDALLQAYEQFSTSGLESLSLCLVTERLSVLPTLMDTMMLAEPELSAKDVAVSLVKVQGDVLVDIIDPDSRVSMAQDDNAVYRVRGASFVGAAKGHEVLKASGEDAACILQIQTKRRTATIVQLPLSEHTRSVVLALARLINALMESGGPGNTYFPYRDSAVTKLLWERLLCAPQMLNVLLVCSTDSPNMTELLQVGDRLVSLMAQTSSNRSALKLQRDVGSGDLKVESEALAEIVRKVKQIRAEANAAEYARRESTIKKRARERELQHRISICTLAAKLASLEAERKRKVEALDYKKRQHSAWQSSEKAACRHQHLKSELESAASTLQALQQEVKANQRALAAALMLTPEERKRGNIRQAEFNLRTLRAQYRQLAK